MSKARYPVALLASGLNANKNETIIDYYTKLAQQAEVKGIELFIVDHKHDEYVWEPQVLLGHLMIHTVAIGLGVPISINYNEPYHVARILATIDHFSKGRIAWQPVLESIFDHDVQYVKSVSYLNQEKRAQEFHDVVRQLWDSWEADAVVNDKVSGQFLNTAKIRHLNYESEFFKVRGPSPVPRPLQGHPISYAIVDEPRSLNAAEAFAEIIFLSGDSKDSIERIFNSVHSFISKQNQSTPLYYVPHALVNQTLSFEFDGAFIYDSELNQYHAHPSSTTAHLLRERLSLSTPTVHHTKIYS